MCKLLIKRINAEERRYEGLYKEKGRTAAGTGGVPQEEGRREPAHHPRHPHPLLRHHLPVVRVPAAPQVAPDQGLFRPGHLRNSKTPPPPQPQRNAIGGLQ
jgi:hypothetical protein